ncbi:hypothetical protein K438DRAFT_2029050 [Mycena galopus ATCC 62051]|nr:hypothetical protein K438DRAFT_2029050 [Mycena galopus ATCC 62051]
MVGALMAAWTDQMAGFLFLLAIVADASTSTGLQSIHAVRRRKIRLAHPLPMFFTLKLAPPFLDDCYLAINVSLTGYIPRSYSNIIRRGPGDGVGIYLESSASTATPSLAVRPKAREPFTSPRSTYPMSSVLPPPTPPSPASLGGRNFAGSDAPSEWRVVGVDSTSAASRGMCEWETDEWGVGVPESLVPRDGGVHQKWDMQAKRADRIDAIAPRMSNARDSGGKAERIKVGKWIYHLLQVPAIQLPDAVRTDTSGPAGIGDDTSSRDVTTHSYMHVFAGAEARHSPE